MKLGVCEIAGAELAVKGAGTSEAGSMWISRIEWTEWE